MEQAKALTEEADSLDSVRDGARAIEIAQFSSSSYWSNLDTLAAAYAEAGKFKDAIEVIAKAIEGAPDDVKPRLEKRKQLYQNSIPYREE